MLASSEPLTRPLRSVVSVDVFDDGAVRNTLVQVCLMPGGAGIVNHPDAVLLVSGGLEEDRPNGFDEGNAFALKIVLVTGWKLAHG